MKFADMKKGYAGLNAGDWIGDLPFPLFEGIRFKVRRIGNPDFLALRDKLGEDVTDLSEDANAKRIYDECLVQTCLVGWDGVDDPYSVETARQMMADPDVGVVFRNAIHWATNELGEQIKAKLEADEKN